MDYTVYIIRHICTGQVLYVGKTKDFKRRAYEHLKLRTETKEWISVIGSGNIFIEAVAKFNNETDALKYEDALILKYDTITNGYNKHRSGLIEAENPKEYSLKWHREYYQKNDKYKEWHREYERKYRQTEKYKEYKRNYRIEYQRTDKYKEYLMNYRKTDEYKERIRAYKRDYYRAKKLGISVSEYRKLKNN